jgi:hypothetical protein
VNLNRVQVDSIGAVHVSPDKMTGQCGSSVAVLWACSHGTPNRAANVKGVKSQERERVVSEMLGGKGVLFVNGVGDHH